MSIAVLDKAFSVIEVLARADRSLTLAELREESRLPKPTVYRILLSLRSLGYVEQSGPRGAYRLSPRLSSLGSDRADAALRSAAWPLMDRLRRQCDETVNLGLLEGHYVRYVAVAETSQALRWIVKPGARDLFWTTALGRAAAAALPIEERRRLFAAALPGARRAAQRSRLLAELEATAQRGYATEEEETVAGVACLAVALDTIAPRAALSISVPVTRFSPGRRSALVAALQEATSFHLAKRA